MENHINAPPFSPKSERPENMLSPTSERSLSTKNHPQTSSDTNGQTSDQGIESAFSGLTLYQNFQPRVLRPSVLVFPATMNRVAPGNAVPLPVPLLWAPRQRNIRGVNGPYGFVGAHQNINVGAEGMGLLGSGSYLDAGENTPNWIEAPDSCNDTCDNDNDESSSLHDKKQLSRRFTNDFPALISAEQCLLTTPVYNNQFWKKWDKLLTLENMRGKIVSLAQDQVFSGILNLKLEERLSEEEIEMVLREVMHYLGDLMRNQYGNIFFQKLVAACDEDQRTRMVLALTKPPYKLINCCFTSYGSRAVQSLLEKLTTPGQIFLVMSSLRVGAAALATDPNGYHLILYCVRHLAAEYNKDLFSELASKYYKIGCNKSGCCVLQLCMEKADQESRELFITNIIANALYLAVDPYGNYVVQHLLEMRIEKATADLLRQCQGCFLPFSCNKYASNVVEKFFLYSGENHSATIINELLRSPEFSTLLFDPFGNFVIQRALSASTGHIHEALVQLIQENEALMQSNTYGRKLLASLGKELHNT